MVFAVSFALIAALLWRDAAQSRAYQRRMVQKEAEIRPLSVRLYECEHSIHELERENATEQAGTGTVQFLVTDLSVAGWHTVVEPMLDYGYPLTLGLTLTRYPGAEGCLTTEQAQPCLFCYAYDPAEAAALNDDPQQALALWLEQLTQHAAAQELNLQPVLYFPAGSYLPDAAPVLQAAGIEAVIHHGETGTGLMTPQQQDGIWYVGSAWWLRNEILASKLHRIGTIGGQLVTVMGCDDMTQTTVPEWMYDFAAVTGSLNLRVTDFTEMMQVQAENERFKAAARSENQQQIEELQAQCAELHRQIDEIEQRYALQEDASNQKGE